MKTSFLFHQLDAKAQGILKASAEDSRLFSATINMGPRRTVQSPASLTQERHRIIVREISTFVIAA